MIGDPFLWNDQLLIFLWIELIRSLLYSSLILPWKHEYIFFSLYLVPQNLKTWWTIEPAPVWRSKYAGINILGSLIFKLGYYARLALPAYSPFVFVYTCVLLSPFVWFTQYSHSDRRRLCSRMRVNSTVQCYACLCYENCTNGDLNTRTYASTNEEWAGIIFKHKYTA